MPAPPTPSLCFLARESHQCQLPHAQCITTFGPPSSSEHHAYTLNACFADVYLQGYSKPHENERAKKKKKISRPGQKSSSIVIGHSDYFTQTHGCVSVVDAIPMRSLARCPSLAARVFSPPAAQKFSVNHVRHHVRDSSVPMSLNLDVSRRFAFTQCCRRMRFSVMISGGFNLYSSSSKASVNVSIK